MFLPSIFFAQRKTSLTTLLIMFVVLFSSLNAIADQPGNPEYSWLNGKWRGPVPSGGYMILEIRVVNDNEVAGKANIDMPGARKRWDEGDVSGIVKGKKVRLEARWPKGQKSSYNLQLENGALVNQNPKGFGFNFEKIE